jgi:hypothetical protein
MIEKESRYIYGIIIIIIIVIIIGISLYFALLVNHFDSFIDLL